MLAVCRLYVTRAAFCASASMLHIMCSTSAYFSICVDALNLIPRASTKVMSKFLDITLLQKKDKHEDLHCFNVY